MRAVTIQTPNVATGVAGMVMPGNKVDVMLTVTESGAGSDATGGGSATTLLQRVEVLAVDQRVDGPAEHKVDSKELRSVTLLVSPHQANLLDLGQNKGILHLSLRNPDDKTDANTKPVTLADLRFHQEKPWDERIKGVLDSLAKAQRATAPPATKAVATSPAPTAPMKIRTIRGGSEGSVFINANNPPTSGLLSGAFPR
jgi:pilus assembly protein CpaB